MDGALLDMVKSRTIGPPVEGVEVLRNLSIFGWSHTETNNAVYYSLQQLQELGRLDVTFKYPPGYAYYHITSSDTTVDSDDSN